MRASAITGRLALAGSGLTSLALLTAYGSSAPPPRRPGRPPVTAAGI